MLLLLVCPNTVSKILCTSNITQDRLLSFCQPGCRNSGAAKTELFISPATNDGMLHVLLGEDRLPPLLGGTSGLD